MEFAERSQRALQAAYAAWKPYRIVGKDGAPLGNGERAVPTIDEEALAMSLELEKW